MKRSYNFYDLSRLEVSECSQVCVLNGRPCPTIAQSQEKAISYKRKRRLSNCGELEIVVSETSHPLLQSEGVCEEFEVCGKLAVDLYPSAKINVLCDLDLDGECIRPMRSPCKFSCGDQERRLLSDECWKSVSVL